MWMLQIAQGWELHTHLDIIREIPYINNQQRKKLYQIILGSAPYCRTNNDYIIYKNYVLF